MSFAIAFDVSVTFRSSQISFSFVFRFFPASSLYYVRMLVCTLCTLHVRIFPLCFLLAFWFLWTFAFSHRNYPFESKNRWHMRLIWIWLRARSRTISLINHKCCDICAKAICTSLNTKNQVSKAVLFMLIAMNAIQTNLPNIPFCVDKIYNWFVESLPHNLIQPTWCSISYFRFITVYVLTWRNLSQNDSLVVFKFFFLCIYIYLFISMNLSVFYDPVLHY